MGAVFISYRRGDSEGQARALSNELAEVIGKDAVFMDVDSIALGRDFRQILQERLASCDVMLALIGPDWLDAQDTRGNRRLDSVSDFVRQEISAALKRNIAVTPVLVQGAQMPPPDRLPDDLKDLAFRNGFELSHTRWESDVRELVKRLGLKAVEPSGPSTTDLRELVKRLNLDKLDAGGTRPRPAAPPPAPVAPPVAPTPPPSTLFSIEEEEPPPPPRAAWKNMAIGAGVMLVAVVALLIWIGSQASDDSSQRAAGPSAAPAGDAPAEPAAPAPAGGVPAAAGSQAAASSPPAGPAAVPAPAEAASPPQADAGAPLGSRAVEPAAAPSTPPVVETTAASAPQAPQRLRAAAAPAAGTRQEVAVPEPGPSARVLRWTGWKLAPGGCRAGIVAMTSVVFFTIDKTAEGVVVTERFRGTSGPYTALVTGRAVFDREQPSYDIPTAGTWEGPMPFRTEGMDRVFTNDGLTPTRATILRLRSIC